VFAASSRRSDRLCPDALQEDAVKINPHAWLLTIPITIGLVQVYLQPADNIFKRLWREFTRLESFVWERLGLPTSLSVARDNTGQRHLRKAMFGLIVAGFACASLASFGAFVGVLQ
jgi:hypothetical protein